MADQSDPSYETEGLSEETARLAALGRGEDLPEDKSETDEGAEDTAEGSQEEAKDDIPEWVPEKFRKDGKADFESLAKAYDELQKKLGAPKEEAEDDDEEEKPQDEGEDALTEEAFREGVQKTVLSAQEEYARDGKLSDETYESLTGLLGKTYVDNYLAGVAAMEAALTQSVYETAGGEENYMAAIEWARENWSETKIAKFDEALGDEDLMPTMVKALMADYQEAEPGEGKATRPGTGVNPSDVYTDKDEFLRDLAKAEQEGDMLARRKAVQKLERSKKAKTLTEITPRSGLSRFQ